MLGKKIKHYIGADYGLNLSRYHEFDLKFIEIDDEKMILDFSEEMKHNQLISGIAICMSALFLGFLFYNKHTLLIIISFFIFIIGVSLILLNFKSPAYHIELNRSNGTISFPLSVFRLKKKIHFKNLKIKRLRLLDTEGNTGSDFCYLSITNYGFFCRTKIYRSLRYQQQENLLLSVWSFYVWYMDKNRPLPPGDAFNTYREQDYERRKATGFPRSLYPGISTPEATEEQQKERIAIGGW